MLGPASLGTSTASPGTAQGWPSAPSPDLRMSQVQGSPAGLSPTTGPSVGLTEVTCLLRFQCRCRLRAQCPPLRPPSPKTPPPGAPSTRFRLLSPAASRSSSGHRYDRRPSGTCSARSDEFHLCCSAPTSQQSDTTGTEACETLRATPRLTSRGPRVVPSAILLAHA
jgi:hypothetical protein